MIVDTNNGIYNWVRKHLPEVNGYPDLCYGWKDKNMVCGVVVEKRDDDAHVSVFAKSPRWCTKKNLTLMADSCYKILKAKKICCLTSEANTRVNKFLDGLGLNRDGKQIISGKEWLAWSLLPEMLKEQKWYKGRNG